MAAQFIRASCCPSAPKSEPPLAGSDAQEFRSIIDVGANTGQFARRMRQPVSRRGTALLRAAGRRLSTTCRMGGRAQGTCTPTILPLETGASAVEMLAHSDHSPSSSLLRRTDLSVDYFPQTYRQQAVMVEMRRLDEVLAWASHKPALPALLEAGRSGDGRPGPGGRTRVPRAVSRPPSWKCVSTSCMRTRVPSAMCADRLGRAGLRYSGNLNQVYAPDGHVIYIDAVFCR